MSRYLTVDEVAEALGVSASWVYKHKDLLGGVRLRKRLWRFPEQELTTLLAHLARGSPQPVMEDADGGRPRQVKARRSWGWRGDGGTTAIQAMYHASSVGSLLVSRDLRYWRVADEEAQRTSLHWREAQQQAHDQGRCNHPPP